MGGLSTVVATLRRGITEAHALRAETTTSRINIGLTVLWNSICVQLIISYQCLSYAMYVFVYVLVHFIDLKSCCTCIYLSLSLSTCLLQCVISGPDNARNHHCAST